MGNEMIQMVNDVLDRDNPFLATADLLSAMQDAGMVDGDKIAPVWSALMERADNLHQTMSALI